MSGFISKAACRGRRPSQFVDYHGFQRQDLITRLLKERGVARFIVAPSGYGKTCLAIDYAETVFEWVHTFFINCQSPCFLRDIDDDSIYEACRETDKQVRLVIFDAVPPLDPERAGRLSREIDQLLALGAEVLVTCSPASDVFGQLQSDQVRLGANDLLLTDDELDLARSVEERAQAPSEQLSAACRVPALAWNDGPSATAAFLKRSFREAMPSDFLLAMASMFVLMKGSLEDLSELGPIDIELVGTMLRLYPHFCFDVDQGTFHAPFVDSEPLQLAVKGQMGAIVSRSLFEASDKLVLAWADILARGGSLARACDIVRVMCPRSKRGAWLSKHALDCVQAGCFYPALKLVRSVSAKSSDTTQRAKAIISALEAICCKVLGDDRMAVASAKRFASDENAPRFARIWSALVLYELGTDANKKQAAAFLEEAARTSGYPAGLSADPDATPSLQPGDALARAWMASFDGVRALAGEWQALRAENAGEEELCIAASRLFGLVEVECREGNSPVVEPGAPTGAVERFVRDRIDRSDQSGTGQVDYFTASAALAMERAHVSGFPYSFGALPTRVLLSLRQVDLSVLRQRQQMEADADVEVDRRGPYSRVRSDSVPASQKPLIAARMSRNVPILELKMFGRFEVAIGGVVLDPKLFRRQSVRSLLVLLAVNQGREVSRDVAAAAMWPKSEDDVARKNFYSVWSQLKRALSLMDGTCPYLLRHQYGCSLEERYVQSDVARLGQICRELLFGRPDFQEWPALYAELDQNFADELMPAEKNNSLIIRARNDHRARLVDALVAATQSVIDAGNPQWGIWFARMAVSHDETREDAYVALMRAQIAGDQRTAAIMTFLKCQRILGEELGVDPSAETVALYESLLE